jgi:hypothetical protein
MSRGRIRIAGWGLAVGLLAAAAAGCGFSGPEHPSAAGEFDRMRAAEPDEPVARVDERALGRGDFQAYWNEHPELEAPSVIDRVLEREVALQRALDADVAVGADLDFVRKQAMVRRLLAEEIEAEIGPEDVDKKSVERIKKGLRRTLGRPAGIRASHLLVMVPQEKNKKKKKKQDRPDPERDRQFEQAREWAAQIRASLPDRPTAEDLFEARRTFQDRVPEPLNVVVNAHLTFPGPDSRPFRGNLPEGWMHVVQEFQKKAGEMVEAGRLEELSEPTRSKYGWHLIRPEGRRGGRIPDPDALHDYAVSRAMRVERNKLLMEKFERWRQGMAIFQFPERVTEQQQQ